MLRVEDFILNVHVDAKSLLKVYNKPPVIFISTIGFQ